MEKHSSEQLSLLLSYLSVIGVWFAIPSVSLLLKRDKRWPIALILLSSIVGILVVAYIVKWRVLFPVPTAEQIYRSTIV
tara:strand:- start:934 stop:1170 length:237 start_codon:yes stop_codon:yes gene_type:complete